MKDDSSPPRSVPRLDLRAGNDRSIPSGSVILIADGDAIARKGTASHLRNRGFTVVEAGSSIEAIEMAELKLPQLILLDVRLPDSDGADAITELKAEAATSSIPIVACGSLGLRHERNRCFTAGAVDWIQRPATADEVLAVIEKHLGAFSGKSRRSY